MTGTLRAPHAVATFALYKRGGQPRPRRRALHNALLLEGSLERASHTSQQGFQVVTESLKHIHDSCVRLPFKLMAAARRASVLMLGFRAPLNIRNEATRVYKRMACLA
eukprot:6214081-Pleurochrysis_carterae.AAC.4